MRTLSVQQPWAFLIVNGLKNVENRNWSTEHRGPLFIHAAQALDLPGCRWVREHFPDIPLPHIENLERGGIVGRARLVDVVRPTDGFESPWFHLHPQNRGFVLMDAEPLPFHPVRGQLGFFEAKHPGVAE